MKKIFSGLLVFSSLIFAGEKFDVKTFFCSKKNPKLALYNVGIMANKDYKALNNYASFVEKDSNGNCKAVFGGKFIAEVVKKQKALLTAKQINTVFSGVSQDIKYEYVKFKALNIGGNNVSDLNIYYWTTKFIK